MQCGPQDPVAFSIGDFEALVQSASNVFADVGGPLSPARGFAWGLPFFLGRKVYVGFEGASSALGTGPYVAY